MAGTVPATEAEPDLARYLQHLRVERRLAPRTLAMYGDGLGWLQQLADDDGVALGQAQAHHIRGWAARLRERGLGPRSIAIALAAWRGLYKHWGRERLVTHNPVDGIRPPKAPKPLPKALGVDQAVALAEAMPDGDAPALRARDHCIVELLYGCGLRVGELVALDVDPEPARGPGAAADRAATGMAGWIDLDDASAHVRGKGGKQRSVPVGPPALAALRAWLVQRGEMARPGERALLVSQRGTRLSDSQVRKRLAALGRAAGVPAMKSIRLREGKERSLLRRHPWVFQGSIAKGQRRRRRNRAGRSSHDGRFLAWGAYSPSSQIRVRAWSFDEAERIDAAFFKPLQRAVALRTRLGIASDGQRLVHGEADGLPGLIVDRYGDAR
jgi:integrase/recombinase XerC